MKQHPTAHKLKKSGWIWFTFILGLFAFSACTTRVNYPSSTAEVDPASSMDAAEVQPVDAIQEQTNLPSGNPDALPSTSPSVSPTGIEKPLRSQYTITANYEYVSRVLSLHESITYLNQSSAPLDSLLLIIEPHRKAEQFSLENLIGQDGEPVDRYTLEEGILQIPLSKPLQTGESKSFELEMIYRLPASASFLGASERQVNLADWYAFAPIYEDEQGWMVRSQAPVGESLLYELSDFWVEFNISGAPTGMQIAAPVPAEKSGDTYRFVNRQARNFQLSFTRDTVFLQDATGRINAYVFAEHRAAGETAVACTSQALALFEGLFGEAGLKTFTLIETEIPDGMEYDGLFFLNQFYFASPGTGVQGGLCTLSVHETAHQWWYRSVANDPALAPWLDEALCTFSELLYYENYYPGMVNWWWGYRVNDYQPQGWVNSSIYDHGSYRSYVNAVYLRGIQFLDAVRRVVGEKIMLDFLRAYADQYRFSLADSDDFFTLLATYTDQDLQPILEQYFSPK